MKDEDLQFDRTCHVLYSKPCKKQIRAKIALYYPTAERETVWERVQQQYAFICRLQQAFLKTHFALVICCIGKEVQRMA